MVPGIQAEPGPVSTLQHSPGLALSIGYSSKGIARILGNPRQPNTCLSGLKTESSLN